MPNKGKGLAIAVVTRMKGKNGAKPGMSAMDEGGEAPPADENEEMESFAEDAAREMLDAMKADDAKAFADAFKNMMAACEESY